MEREVRYCTTDDGVRIAYCVDGDGPPILFCPFFLESFALEGLAPELQSFMRRLGEGRQMVRFDMRGTGLSQRDVADFSHEALVGDLTAVVKAAGLRKVSVVGSGISGPRAIGYAVSHSRYVVNLVLLDTFATASEAMPLASIHGFAGLARGNWPIATRALADLWAGRDASDFGVRLSNLYERSTDGDVAARVLTEARDSSDVKSLLSSVRCRTLVAHHRKDGAFPFAGGQEIAAGIKNARFVPLDGPHAASLFIDADRTLDLFNDFLGHPNPDSQLNQIGGTDQGARTTLRTILFTDIVGHTEMMQRLGDERGRDVLRVHERITRYLLRQYSGAEVKTMGDGFMASFGSVTSALECAIALQRAFAAHTESMPEPLHVRVGLNAGEPIQEDGDLFGATVILASRIAAKAGAGEILVPETVRGLLSGKNFLFSDHGDFVPKGFDDAVRLYEVSWRP